MKCPHCCGEHPADYKFCPVTGKEMYIHGGLKACLRPDCPDYGKYILPKEAKYCPRCGGRLSEDSGAAEPSRSCDSRIVIVCSGDAYIKVGKKRDKKIKLKEGENVIYVTDCPELKYGFSMEDDGHPERILNMNFEDYDTSQVTDMSYMFYGCRSLKSLDLRGLDTSQVTDMSYMFYGCRSLKSLDLCGLDTSQVTVMHGMFLLCRSLESLDLHSLDTSQVTDMCGMFSGCRSLESLDLRGLDTSQVTDMSDMFSCCNSLESLDLRGLDTSQVTHMYSMFDSCPETIQKKYKYLLK